MVLSLFCLEKHVPYLRGIETQYTRNNIKLKLCFFSEPGAIKPRYKNLSWRSDIGISAL